MGKNQFSIRFYFLLELLIISRSDFLFPNSNLGIDQIALGNEQCTKCLFEGSISDNQLEELPLNGENLEYLNVAANQLKFLPSTSYDKVEKLLVDDNNFHVEEEILEEIELLYFGKEEVKEAVIELKKLGIIREFRT